MSFLETPRFPGCPSYGYRSSPKYSVSKVMTAGGNEHRNGNWSRSLLEISFTVGPRMEAEIEAIRDYWHAVGGAEHGFRFKDHADFQSCPRRQTPAALDQPLVAVAGGFQLTKRYIAGALSRDRTILKPVAGTIKVANDSGVEQASERWTLNAATGVVVALGNFVGTPATWGGEFDVPVRFESDFDPEIIDKRIDTVSVVLMELRNP